MHCKDLRTRKELKEAFSLVFAHVCAVEQGFRMPTRFDDGRKDFS